MLFRTFFLLLAAFAVTTTVVVDAQTVKTETSNLVLAEDTSRSCDDVIETSRFDYDISTCCSLNTTNGGGCLLTVTAGRCSVKGEIFSLDYTSSNPKPCPDSEFEVLPTGNDNESEDAAISVMPIASAVGASIAGVAFLLMGV